MTKKTDIKTLIALMTALGIPRSSYPLNLQSKHFNTDKSLFNVISGANTMDKGKFRLFGEANYQMSPLIQKDSQLGQATLVEGLMGIETSILYGLTDKIQIGILIPGQMPFGVLGSYNEIKPSLGDILIEPKVQLTDNVAIIPLYYASTGNPDAGAGTNGGAYGAKVSGEFGSLNKKGVLAFQVGAIFAPDTMYKQLDQSMKYHFGFGAGMKIGNGLKWMAEVYGEKTKSNFPLEALTFLELEKNSWSIRLGAGSGALNGGGSNTARAFLGFSWDLGKETQEKPKIEKVDEGPQVPDFVDYEDTDTEVPQTDLNKIPEVKQEKEEEVKTETKPKEIKGGEKGKIQESDGPDVLSPEEKEEKINLDIDFLSTHKYIKSENKISLIPKSILNSLRECYPYASDDELLSAKAITILMKDRLDCSGGHRLSQGEFKTQKVLYLANSPKASYYKEKTSLEDSDAVSKSEDMISKIEKRLSKVNPDKFPKTKNKGLFIRQMADRTYKRLKIAHKTLNEDIALYQEMLGGSKKKLSKKLNELRWGLRVINKRINYIKKLDKRHKKTIGKSFMESNHLLIPRTAQEIEDYSIARKIVLGYEKDGVFLDKSQFEKPAPKVKARILKVAEVEGGMIPLGEDGLTPEGEKVLAELEVLGQKVPTHLQKELEEFDKPKEDVKVVDDKEVEKGLEELKALDTPKQPDGLTDYGKALMVELENLPRVEKRKVVAKDLKKIQTKMAIIDEKLKNIKAEKKKLEKKSDDLKDKLADVKTTSAKITKKEISGEKRMIVDKELKLLKEEIKKAQMFKNDPALQNLPEEGVETKKIKIEKVEKVNKNSMITIKEKGEFSIILPQVEDVRVEPKIPDSSEEFQGLEDEDGIEEASGPSFD